MSPRSKRAGPAGGPATRTPKNATANRALIVLSVFTRFARALTLTDISNALAMDKSVVHRILDTLVYQRFVEQNPATKRYRVGLRAWEIGQHYRGAELEHIATPLLKEIVDRHGGTAYVAQLDGLDIVYLALIDGPGPLRVHVNIGSRLPSYATALDRKAHV